MTRRLILVRHAKSSWDGGEFDDHERPLNGRGKRSALMIGTWLREKGRLPERVLSSDSTRTRETWRLIEEELNSGADERWRRDLYHADAQTMLDTLRSAGNASTILMIGHNPGTAIFANMVVEHPPPHTRYRDYPTAATADIVFSLSRWMDVEWCSGTVIDFVIPRELGA
ncbi:MAG: histidine phosphatase family protein [Rhodobacter sp.]|nr:histidine phosphatase family protein [Rhodobacter sp.]